MIDLPHDRRLEIAERIMDLYESCGDLDEFKAAIKAEFPDDPTLAYGYIIGLAVGRLEQKTRITNDLLDISSMQSARIESLMRGLWGGNEIRLRDRA